MRSRHTLVEMPFVANPRKATTDLVGKLLAELARPLSDGFVADDDAAGRQQLLNHAKPERAMRLTQPQLGAAFIDFVRLKEAEPCKAAPETAFIPQQF